MKGKLAFALMGLPLIGAAQTFNDNFDAGTSAGSWTVYDTNTGTVTNPINNDANFAYDYSLIGIPSAPGSTGGSTMGMRLRVNRVGSAAATTAALPGFSVSPTGGSFGGDVTLTFDAWQNFIKPGASGLGGSGSTQMLLGGILNNGTMQSPGVGINGLSFAGTGDGNSTADYRVYAAAGAPIGTSVLTAGSAADSNIYYTSRFQGAIPAAQTTIEATQTGVVRPGALGFSWNTWEIKKVGSIVTWKVRPSVGPGAGTFHLLSTVDLTTLSARAGQNFSIGVSDINNGSSTDPLSDLYTASIIDNVQMVPEPGTMAALGLGAVALMRRRRSK